MKIERHINDLLIYPDEEDLMHAAETVQRLMYNKLDDFILENLPIGSLIRLRDQIDTEIKRRNDESKT